MKQLKEHMKNFTEDEEIMLILKMSQLCLESNDSSDDERDAPRKMHGDRMYEKEKGVERKRSLTSQELQIKYDIDSYQVRHHECDNRMQDVQEYEENGEPMEVRA